MNKNDYTIRLENKKRFHTLNAFLAKFIGMFSSIKYIDHGASFWTSTGSSHRTFYPGDPEVPEELLFYHAHQILR